MDMDRHGHGQTWTWTLPLTDRRTLTCLPVYPQRPTPSTPLCVAFSGRAGPTARSELPHANRAAADPSCLALALAADSTSSLTFGQGRLRYRPSILGPRPSTLDPALNSPGLALADVQTCRRAAQRYLQPSFLCFLPLWPPSTLANANTPRPLRFSTCAQPSLLSPITSSLAPDSYIAVRRRPPLSRARANTAELQNPLSLRLAVLSEASARPEPPPACLTLPYLRSTQLFHLLTISSSSSAAVPERIIRFDISGLQRLRQSRVSR
jgi:hypothetical protein